jgi:hypothetical protein
MGLARRTTTHYKSARTGLYTVSENQKRSWLTTFGCWKNLLAYQKRESMAGIAYAAHYTPEPLRVLIIEAILAVAITYLWWRLGLPMRGGLSRKDGPLPGAAKWVIAILSMVIFLFLALTDAIQRRQMGLPVF